jgi:hypothetical protein
MDPRLAQLNNGLRSRPSTLDVLAEVDPVFAQARRESSTNPAHLCNPEPILVDLLALRRMFAQRVRISVDDQGLENAPALLEVLQAILAAQDRASRIIARTEEVRGYDRRLVDGFIANAAAVITQFVPPEHVSEALSRLRHLQAALTPPR